MTWRTVSAPHEAMPARQVRRNTPWSRRCRGRVHTVPRLLRVGCHVRRLDRSRDWDPLHGCPRTLIRRLRAATVGQTGGAVRCMSPPARLALNRGTDRFGTDGGCGYRHSSSPQQRSSGSRRGAGLARCAPSRPASCRKTRPCTCSAHSAPRGGRAGCASCLARRPCPEASGFIADALPTNRLRVRCGHPSSTGTGRLRDRYWPCLRPYGPGSAGTQPMPADRLRVLVSEDLRGSPLVLHCPPIPARRREGRPVSWE